MYAPLHLVRVHVVGAAQDDGRGSARLGSLNQDELVIADPDLAHLLGLAQQTRLEALLTLDVGEAGHEAGAGGLGDLLEVLPVAGDDGGGVDLLLHQLGGVLEELGGDDDDAGGTVTHLKTSI